MSNEIILKYFEKLKNANSPSEIDSIIDEVFPVLKMSKIPITQLLEYFKIHEKEIETKSQDHRNSISNSLKAQLILQKLMVKLKENG